MKFLIAGLGSIGRRHLRNLAALGQRDIHVYRTNKGIVPDKDLPPFQLETDLQHALDQKPDGVIIANPTSQHLPVAIAAAEAGCHLLLEKPVSDQLEGIEALESALTRNHRKCLVGFQFRFHPGLQKIVELLKRGAIGKVLHVHAQWGEYLPNWHPWEDYRQGYSARSDLGGGVVLTLCHPLDYLTWMLGDVDQLWAFSGKISDLEINVDDYAEVGLHFSSGAVGSLHLDYFRKPAEHHLEIVGSEGTIEWRNETGTTRIFDPEKGQWQDFPLKEGFERNDLFLAEMKHFLDVIEGRSEPLVDLQDGKRSLFLAIAVHASATAKKLIHLPIREQGEI